MSEVKVNKISPRSGTDVTLGDSGDVFSYGSGAGGLGGLASVQTFTSSGTWTKPTGVVTVIMKVQGGGGGGSRGTQNSGGAGGGYCEKFLDVSSISTSTITIGAAGAATAVDGSGGDGGASSWADGTNTITGGGGDGGDASATYAIAYGGTATGGDVNIVGQTAMQSPSWNSSGGSVLGFGGLYPPTGVAEGAQDAVGYGGGGSAWSGYAQRTGAGSQGIVIVWEYK